MNGYCHTKRYELRYSDLDFRDELKLSALLGLVQESACTSADELGFGYEAIKPFGYGFITAQTYGEIVKPIVRGDAVTVETWPLPPRHVIFDRHYRVKNDKGEICALLASRWCLVDLKTFSVLPPSALGSVHERCPYNPEKVVEIPAGKIRKLGEDVPVRYRMTVHNSACDHYLHANNARYADYFLDCFSMEELGRISRFRICYLEQAKEGRELALYREDEGDSSILEMRGGEETIARFRATFEEIG